MNESLRTAGYGELATGERHRVLRNTYALLALSLVPTVAGAWVGIATGFNALFAGRIWLSLLVFFGGAFAFLWAIERNKNNGLGVALLLAFTFFMGLMLSRLVGAVLGLKNGGDLVMMAFGGTAIIFAAMATLGTVIRRDLSAMGKFLFVGALVVMIGAVAAAFLQVPALTLTILVLCLAIFSAYMLYDINQIVTGGETNYVSATLALYLDIFNVFQSLLSLLGIFGGERE
jgi:modulator of FtsH protease